MSRIEEIYSLDLVGISVKLPSNFKKAVKEDQEMQEEIEELYEEEWIQTNEMLEPSEYGNVSEPEVIAKQIVQQVERKLYGQKAISLQILRWEKSTGVVEAIFKCCFTESEKFAKL